jgi:hypothetical protein
VAPEKIRIRDYGLLVVFVMVRSSFARKMGEIRYPIHLLALAIVYSGSGSPDHQLGGLIPQSNRVKRLSLEVYK